MAWCSTRTVACWRSLAPRTCVSRSPTRSPGPGGCEPDRGGSISPRSRGWSSSRPTPNGFRPCASRAGGGAPTILSAANEVAVEPFLHRRIGYLDIAATAGAVLDAMGAPEADSLDQVMALDHEARRRAQEAIATACAA